MSFDDYNYNESMSGLACVFAGFMITAYCLLSWSEVKYMQLNHHREKDHMAELYVTENKKKGNEKEKEIEMVIDVKDSKTL
jgi:hypothetical protein